MMSTITTATMIVAALGALPPTMPVSEVKGGMHGQCQTVFEGDKIEPMDFVVKGIMSGMLGPNKDVVLIRLEGKKPEFTGVVAGMSGSPCFIDGKLVGALAYAFASFAKEPIAGVTPIADMLEVLEQPKNERPWRLAANQSKTPDNEAHWQAMREGRALDMPGRVADLVPIAAPLSMSGVPLDIQQHFAPYLESLGFVPVAGGIAGKGEAPAALKAGGAIAGVLVRGDVSIAGTGTVTTVDGNKVLAFGHPFFGVGPVSIPMATATIINTMASSLRSFKMSNTGEVVGEITEDRLTAIGGFLGKGPRMIPVHGEIEGMGAGVFDFEVARDAQLTPRLLGMALASSLSGRVGASAKGLLRLEAVIHYGDLEGNKKSVRVQNVYSAQRDGNLFVYAGMDVAQVVGMLWNNPLGPPPDMKIELKVKAEPESLVEWVEAVHLDRGQARVGDNLEVAVRMRQEDGPSAIERFVIKVPTAWAGKEIEFVAAGVYGAEKLDMKISGMPVPRTLEEIGIWLNKRRDGGYLYLMAHHKGAGVQVGISSMANIPGSAATVLGAAPRTYRRKSGLAWEEHRNRDGFVFGKASAKLKIRR